MAQLVAKSDICLLYASESGTSYDLACRVSSLAKRRLLPMTPQGMDDALCGDAGLGIDPVSKLRALAMANNGLVVFVVSTTGDGEVPKNMENSWRALLKRSVPADALSGVRFALYGIGDRGYGHKFCAAARKLDGRLRQIGAVPLTERVLGDEQDVRGGVLALFSPWLESLWKALLDIHPLPDGMVVSDVPSLDPPSSVVAFEETKALDSYALYGKGFEGLGLRGDPLLVKVSSNIRMTAETWSQDVRQLSLDMGSGESWEAGDVAWLLPENSPSSVQDMLRFTNLDPSTVVTVTSAPNCKATFEGQCSAQELFSRVLAIDSLPRPFAFEQLGLCATNEEEKEKLLEIGGPEGVDLYYDYCYREKRSWVEVFRDFASLRPPLEQLLTLIPRLLPRAFSIASPPPLTGQTTSPTVVLSVAVVNYKTPYGRSKEGTCSAWVRGLVSGDVVPFWKAAGSFPSSTINNVAKPLILIGPGTGVAPMRSIALHRSHMRSITPSDQQDVLFFGCRGRTNDYLFGEELSSVEGLNFHTAFSREQTSSTGGRLYVTHLLKQHGQSVFEAIVNGGSIFVAGSAGSMPKDVHSAIISVLSTHGGMSVTEASDLVKKMERQRKYCVEAYG